MAKFDAGTAVDPMEVDFSKFGGPVGVIPEPTGPQVELFMDRLKDYRKKRGDLIREGEKVQESGDEEAMDKWVESIPDEELKAESKQHFTWVDELTSNFLDAAMLEKLPPRVWGAFFKWLVGELNPKAKD